MAETITLHADEGSGYLAGPFTFEDELDQSITPSSVTWRLTDLDGNVINSRTGESVTPDSSGAVYIVLDEDDLAITDDEEVEEDTVKRRIRISFAYDTTINGTLYSDRIGAQEYELTIDNHKAVTPPTVD